LALAAQHLKVTALQRRSGGFVTKTASRGDALKGGYRRINLSAPFIA